MAVSVAATVRTGADAADGWLASLRALVPVPDPHREETVDRAAALRLLRCSPDVLDRLVDAGLPHAGPDDAPRFDSHDLYNLALSSGSRRSVAELTTSIVIRLTQAEPEAWLQPRRWRLSLEMRCPRGDECGGDPEWRVWLPGRDAAEQHRGRESVRAETEFATHGERRTLHAAALRNAFEEVVATRRFQSLPDALETDIAHLESAAAINCVGAGVLLAHRARRQGFEAVARKGWLLGMLGVLPHGWAEVRDDDGAWKVLEPSLVMVSRMAGARPHPDFAELCRGSRLNRVAACGAAPGEPLALHRCAGQAAAATLVGTLVQP
jgi:hypothetical protein